MFKVVADLEIKIQVLNISSIANKDLHLNEYVTRVKNRISSALNGLSPYQINSVNKPKGEGTPLREFNIKLNLNSTKEKLDENKKTAGAN